MSRTSTSAGHASIPHTADLRVEAWGPAPEACLAEAVRGVVETFVDTSGLAAKRTTTFEVTGDTDADLLVAVLEELIYLLDTTGAVPVTVEVARRDGAGAGSANRGGAASSGGALRVRFGLAPLPPERTVGAVPKAVTLHGLEFARHDGQCRCSVTLDV